MQHESSRAIDTRPIVTRAPRRSQIRTWTTLRHRDCRGPRRWDRVVSRCFDWDGSGCLVSQSSPLAVNFSHFPVGKLKLCTLREVRDLHTLSHTFLHFVTLWESYTHFPPREKVRQSYTELKNQFKNIENIRTKKIHVFLEV
jgi:hypothetical protein